MPVPSSARASTRSARAHLDLSRLVAAGLLWGTGGLSGSLLGRVAELSPLAVAGYRLAGGGVVLLGWLALTRRLRPLPRPGRRRVLLVAALFAVYQGCYFTAVAATGIAVATLVTLGAAPVLVLAVETIGARRRPGPVPSIAAGLVLVGLALLVGVPQAGGSAGRLMIGVGLALVGAAGFAGQSLLGRRPVAGLDVGHTLAHGFLAAAVPVLAASTLTGGPAFTPTGAALGLLAFLGCVPTALAYLLFFVGLRGVAASSAAVVAVLEPVTATVLGVLVLGQRLGPSGVTGAILLCAAAVLASVAGARRDRVIRSGRRR